MSNDERPSLQQIYMEFAFSLARRSTCQRLQVGSVITTADLHQVLSIGYNGTGKGLPHDCDPEKVGACGDLHSEINALIKCGRQHPDKVMFVTDSPCHMCAKAIINSGFSKVYYRRKYRITDGLNALHAVGIAVEQI
jgi:dCMP deaminase